MMERAVTALELAADWHRTQHQLQKLYTWPRPVRLVDAVNLLYAIRENEFAAQSVGMLIAGQFEAANDPRS